MTFTQGTDDSGVVVPEGQGDAVYRHVYRGGCCNTGHGDPDAVTASSRRTNMDVVRDEEMTPARSAAQTLRAQGIPVWEDEWPDSVFDLTMSPGEAEIVRRLRAGLPPRDLSDELDRARRRYGWGERLLPGARVYRSEFEGNFPPDQNPEHLAGELDAQMRRTRSTRMVSTTTPSPRSPLQDYNHAPAGETITEGRVMLTVTYTPDRHPATGKMLHLEGCPNLAGFEGPTCSCILNRWAQMNVEEATSQITSPENRA